MPLRGCHHPAHSPAFLQAHRIRGLTATPRSSLWPSLAQVPQPQLRSGGSAGAAPAERDPDRAAAEGRDEGCERGKQGSRQAGMKGERDAGMKGERDASTKDEGMQG